MQKTILIFHLILIAIVNAQNNDPNYVLEYITTSQGLPHDYVTSIISDDLNAKWIGTENGLAKYNGYNFEIIKPGKSYKLLFNEGALENVFLELQTLFLKNTVPKLLGRSNPRNVGKYLNRIRSLVLVNQRDAV